jgi:uncharacterized protein YjiK
MKNRHRAVLLVLLLLGLLALASWKYKVLPLAYYWWSMSGAPVTLIEQSLWLPHYRASIEGKPIKGVAENVSGLTFSKATGTLFSVTNKQHQILELDTSGVLLRTITLLGASDPEGISHVRDDLFVLADEKDHQLYWVRIGATTQSIDLTGVARLGLAIDLKNNLGFEGVSWDYAGQRLFVVKEKSPLRVFEISGLAQLLAGSTAPMNLQITEWLSPKARGLFMTDLSSLTYHEKTGHLLLLSHESKVIVEYQYDGTPVSLLPMWAGFHGLTAFVPQAEGVALGADGALFVISEPNLFYRFDREPKPR